jgi:hypothetical protein|tara:strand:+ start:775 stop:933 length:159 start_codon:yes stop_codon:yes gene_type:complete
MAAKRWKAKIKIQGVGQQMVYVEADNQWLARKMIEMKYGKGSIIGSQPRQVR